MERAGAKLRRRAGPRSAGHTSGASSQPVHQLAELRSAAEVAVAESAQHRSRPHRPGRPRLDGARDGANMGLYHRRSV